VFGEHFQMADKGNIIALKRQSPYIKSAAGSMPFHAYLESLPSVSTDYSEFKTASLVLLSAPTLPLSYARYAYLPAFTAFTRQRVTFKVAGLVYLSLHETFPAYLSSLLHVCTLQHECTSIRFLQSSTFLFSRLLICWTTILELYQTCFPFCFVQIRPTSNLLPLSPRSHPNSKLTSLLHLLNKGHRMNSPRL